jgi:hypothetical protein
VRRTAARQSGHRVLLRRGDAHHLADRRQQVLDHLQVLARGVRPGGDGRHRFVDEDGGDPHARRCPGGRPVCLTCRTGTSGQTHEIPEDEMADELTPLTADELAAEGATALPDKEVISLLDLNADLDLALDLAAPVDLAVAANANVAAPIDAAVAANVLSLDSSATALADQDVLIDQGISGEAVADAPQDSAIDQGSDGTLDDGTVTQLPTTDPADALQSGLLNVDLDLAADVDAAAPINGAVAANANVAAPIDAAVAANVASVGSEAVAVADQDAVINQQLDDVTAEATAEQTSEITQ